MDGLTWNELKRDTVPINVTEKQRLTITAIGSEFTVSLNEKELFTHRDQTYKFGTVGLRVTDIPTTFSELNIRRP